MAEELTIAVETEESNKGNALKKEMIIVSLGNGCTVTASCEAAGISRKTFYRWLKADTEFAELVAHTEQSATLCVEDALWNKAVDGNVTAMIFWLCNREADRWKNVNKVEVEDITKYSDDKLDKIIRDLSRQVGISESINGESSTR